MIAIVAALQDEIAPLLPKIEVVKLTEVEGSPLREARIVGQESLLAQSGPGRARAQLVGGYVSQNYPLTALISIGFCGAVREGLKSGDIVLGATASGEGESQTYASDLALLQQAASALESANVRFHTGGSLTGKEIVGEPAAKTDLGRSSPEIASVDMETYWLAEIADRDSVPFLVMRVILDEVGDWVPGVPLVDETGVVQRAKAMGYLMQHPQRAPALIKLGSAVPKASTSLANAVLALLEQVTVPKASNGNL